MKLDLRPGEYVVWENGDYKNRIFLGLLVAGILLLPLWGLGLILIIIAVVYLLYFGSDYVVTNMRALLLSRRGISDEVALDAPDLIVGLEKIYHQWRWEERGHWENGQYVEDERYRVPDNSPTGYSNVYFVVNGVEQLSFDLPDQTAQELVTMLASMGIKLEEHLS